MAGGAIARIGRWSGVGATALAALLAGTRPARAQAASDPQPPAAQPADPANGGQAAPPAIIPIKPTLPAIHPTGRISFYTNVASLTPDGMPASSSSEFITSVNFQMPEGEGDGTEYAVDFRQASYNGIPESAQLSIYDGYLGRRFAGGRFRVRAGQMWLTELGGLGSVAGGLFEYREPVTTSPLGRWRFGGFGGVEPQTYSIGYVPGVKKFGGYAVLEGRHGRRDSVGFIYLGDGGLTEREVVTTTNFLSAKSRLFLYQSAEVDLVGPAGQGHGGLTYFFGNARVEATSRVEVQALYHRGRSIDTRAITDDILNGRPLQIGALDALLYESEGGRVTVKVTRDIRVNASYTVDRNSVDTAPTGRATFGLYASSLARLHVDTTVNWSRIERPDGQYNALYFSVGRQIGRRLYLSGDYSSSISIAHFTTSDGVTVDLRPRTRELTASSVVNLGRRISLLITGERTRDDTSTELRVLAGLTYRLR